MPAIDATAPPQPLILSWLAHDVHAAAVRWALRRGGLQPVWAQTLADPAMTPVSLYADAVGGLRFAGGIRSGTASSVWFRRPRLPEAFPGAAAADLVFLRDEWKRHVANVHAVAGSADGVFWVNRPDLAAAAENKLLQLRAAHRCGLRFPATLVSSDPGEIRRFFAAHPAVIHKPYATHSWRDAEGRIFSTYARLLAAEDLRDDDALRLCPAIYQACVRKRRDLRVTVIGQRMFAAAVEADDAGDGVVDWRAAAIGGGERWRTVALPAAAEASLRQLMDTLGLAFGCIDLVVDEHDHLHFLEINQAGQFLFVEHALPELPLLRATAAMLGQARVDYTLEAMPADIAYAAFLQDPEEIAWWASVAGGIRGADGAIPGVSEE
jgi:glutathione synthase/RimK-type ligase-like ATP-grasp enzyme